MEQSILIVEDNEKNLYMITFLLTHKGYKILQARTGPEGIEMAKKNRPDLILLDIQLPGMDGFSVAKELKKSEDTKSIPVVAVTSFAMAGDREKAINAGCDGYIEKPINPETFVSDVVKFIRA